MRFKKLVCILVCLSFLLALIAGCSKPSGNDGTTTTKAAGTTAPGQTTAAATEDPLLKMEKTLEISWLGAEGQAIEDGNYVQKKIEEMFNVKLVNTKISTQDKEPIDLMIHSGDMPDAAFLYKTPTEMYAGGVTRSIPRSLIEKYMPNYTKMMNDHNGWIKNKVQGTDDEYMALTGIALNLEGLIILSMYRLDWLENLNMVPDLDNMQQIDDKGRVMFSPDSLTLDELEEILIAFTKNDPDQNNKDDTYGMTGGEDIPYMWDSIMGAFGFVGHKDHTYEYNVNVDGKLYSWVTCPQFKDFLKLAAKWHKLGIIDPEFVTLGRSQQWEKTGAGTAGWWPNCMNYVDYTATYTFNRPPMNILNSNPDAKILITAPEYGPTGLRGSRPWTQATPLNYDFFIAEGVDDEKLVRIMQIFDFINYDKEAVVWSRWGEEGTHFTWSGEPYKSVPINNEGIVKGAHGLTYYNHPIYNEDYMVYQYAEWPAKLAQWTLFGEGKDLIIWPHKYDYFNETNLQDIITKYEPDCQAVWQEFYYKAITGEVDVESEWDSYLKRMSDAGIDYIIEEMDKAPLVKDIRGE